LQNSKDRRLLNVGGPNTLLTLNKSKMAIGRHLEKYKNCNISVTD